MMGFRCTFSFICSLCLLCSVVWADGSLEQKQFMGKAYDIDSGELIYTEQHSIQYQSNGAPVSGKVVYTQATGEALALKHLNYGNRPFAPSFEFEDKRLSYVLQVQVEGDQLSIDSQQGQDSVPMPKGKPAVVDAGFNYFMQQSLPKLKQGQTLDLAFLAVGRAEFYGFEVSPEEQSNGSIRIKLAPSAWVLSVLVDPIYLTYDVQTGRLLRYEGLGNIEQVKNGKGLDENYVVRIEYEYPQ